MWKIAAFLQFEGYECDIVYNFSPEIQGYQLPLPDGWVCRLDTDGEINPDNYLDLSLYQYNLDHKGDPGGDWAIIDTVTQTGEIETWYIIAGIPEPAVAQLGGLVLGSAWIFQRLRRR